MITRMLIISGLLLGCAEVVSEEKLGKTDDDWQNQQASDQMEVKVQSALDKYADENFSNYCQSWQRLNNPKHKDVTYPYRKAINKINKNLALDKDKGKGAYVWRRDVRPFILTKYEIEGHENVCIDGRCTFSGERKRLFALDQEPIWQYLVVTQAAMVCMKSFRISCREHKDADKIINPPAKGDPTANPPQGRLIGDLLNEEGEQDPTGTGKPEDQIDMGHEGVMGLGWPKGQGGAYTAMAYSGATGDENDKDKAAGKEFIGLTYIYLATDVGEEVSDSGCHKDIRSIERRGFAAK